MNLDNEHDLESILREFSSSPDDLPEPDDTSVPVEETSVTAPEPESPPEEDLLPSEEPDDPEEETEAETEDGPEEDEPGNGEPEDDDTYDEPEEPSSPHRSRRDYDDYDEAEYAERKPRRKWILPLCIFLFLVLLIGGGATYFAYRVEQSDRIFPNVYVGGIDIGGMTRQEAADMLDSCNWDKSISGALEVRLPLDVTTSIDYTTAGLRTTSTTALNAAEAYGREGNMFEVAYNYINAMIMPVDVTDRTYEVNEEYVDDLLAQAIVKFDEICAESAYGVDRENERFVVLKGAGEIKIDAAALKEKVLKALANNDEAVMYQVSGEHLVMPDFEKVREEIYSEPSDAYYDSENDVIVDEVIGVDFDVTAAEKMWSAAEPLTYVYIPIKATYAEITGSQLRSVLFRDVLGEFTTSFKGSIPNRCSNINLAVSTINGTVLLPGETFSYNETLGQRTEEKGYLMAGAYDNGTVTEAIGGGICQVSSTLCVAVRLANLAYERANHQFRVNYMDAGLDATVDWPNRDFKFTNTRDYPVRIHAVCDNDEKTVTIQIIGTDVDGSYVVIENTYFSAFTHAQYFTNDLEHCQAYLNTYVGDIYKSVGKHYDKDGNLLDIIYTNQDYCMYLRHDVVYPEDTGPEAPAEETGSEAEGG
ncbi:MAG: VanW family protein [Oscillospiraceae bacterium]|nr:VanW family protein [Oscillospiraceae bacterium]